MASKGVAVHRLPGVWGITLWRLTAPLACGAWHEREAWGNGWCLSSSPPSHSWFYARDFIGKGLVWKDGYTHPPWAEMGNDFGDDDLHSLSRTCFRQRCHLETVLLQLLGRWGECSGWGDSECLQQPAAQGTVTRMETEGQPGLLAQCLPVCRWSSFGFLLRTCKFLACNCCILDMCVFLIRWLLGHTAAKADQLCV